LDSGAIGDLVQVSAGQLIGRLGRWLSEPARGGGPLLYVGSHALDQVLWFVGRPVERVYAEVPRESDDATEADALFTLRFNGGVLASVTCSQRMGGRYGWIDLIGTHGRMRSEWESDVFTIESKKVSAYQHLT